MKRHQKLEPIVRPSEIDGETKQIQAWESFPLENENKLVSANEQRAAPNATSQIESWN